MVNKAGKVKDPNWKQKYLTFPSPVAEAEDFSNL